MEEYQSKTIEEFSIEVGYILLQYINLPLDGMKPTQKKEMEKKIEHLKQIYKESLESIKGRQKEIETPGVGLAVSGRQVLGVVGGSHQEQEKLSLEAIPSIPRQEIDVKSSRAVGREVPMINPYYGQDTGLANAPVIQPPRQYSWQ